MFQSPLAILAVLLTIESLILILSDHPKTGRFFKYLPSMFWIYFVPMVISSCGLIPAKSEIYSAITTWCLPASLVLLLLCVDMRAILRLGPIALAMMALACLGIMVGACAVTVIYRPWLPEEAWKAIGALSASWTGGSANMIAVAKALDTPNSVYFPVMVVDTIVPYLWMGLLIAGAAYQVSFDRWNKSRTGLLAELSIRTQSFTSVSSGLTTSHVGSAMLVAAAGLAVSGVATGYYPNIAWKNLALPIAVTFASVSFVAIPTTRSFLGRLALNCNTREATRGMVMILLIAIAGAGSSVYMANHLPRVAGLVNTAAWIIVIATILGIAMSFTGARRLESAGASKIGFAMLYLVLASIGATASLAAIAAAPVFIAAGLTWIVIHGIFVLAAARLFRAPLALAASASQAAVGGCASAPVVAGIYNSQLAPVGLLLAILGNIVGTPLGILTAHLCHLVW